MKKTHGFMLLQVLIIAMTLCAVMYFFISTSQIKQKRLNSSNVGSHLSILTNTLLENILVNNQCSDGKTYPLSQCATISDQFKSTLLNDGLDITTATATVIFTNKD